MYNKNNYMLVIGNSPFRNAVNPAIWVLANIYYFTTGGSWSRDPLNFISDVHLTAVSSTDLKEIYSICLARTPERELEEIKRHESFGIDIPFIRIGNEEGNYSFDLRGVKKGDSFNVGYNAGLKHYNDTLPYKNILKNKGYRFIYCGVFVSNQVGERYNLARDGWNKALVESCDINDIIDLHIYRDMDKERVNMDYFSTINEWKQSICTIECGVNTGNINGRMDEFLIQTEEIWNDVKSHLRPIDFMGVQLVENTGSKVGLIYNGELTELGVIFNNLFPKEIVPNIITIVDKEIHWGSYFSAIWDWFSFTLSDGIKTPFKSYKKSRPSPSIGDVWLP
jgi:hypothetical protein